MEREEKIFALQLLLEDMRGSFPISGWRDNRMAAANELSYELGFKAHTTRIQELESHDYRDGRHFGTSVENGGYQGMDALHGLKDTFHDKSLEFRVLMEEILEHPENAFTDWDQPPNKEEV